MRVLVVSSLYPNSVMPHLGLFVHRRVEAVARRGVEVRVVAPVPLFPRGLPLRRGRAYAAVPEREDFAGIPVLHPRYAHAPGPGMYVQAGNLSRGILPHLRALRRDFDFDLVDAHYIYPDGVGAVRLARELGVPCVLTARGSDINLLSRYRLVRRQIRDALGRADALVAVSGALAGAMRGLGAEPHKLHVVPNGIDREIFHYGDPVQARGRLGLSADGNVLLSVGNLNELKGHALVVEAVAQLRACGVHARYHIIGEGEERPRLEALIRRLDLQDRVILNGSVANESLRPWYQAASLFVLASSREGWPNVLNEALACGLPAVATRVGGVPEIVRNGDNGLLVEERSDTAIATALRVGLERSWDRRALAAQASRHSWSDVAERLVRLFSDVAHVPPPAACPQPAFPEPAAASR